MAGKKRPRRGWSFKPGSPLKRGFDTPQLFKKDSLERLKWLSEGIATSKRQLTKAKKELSEKEKRFKELRKSLGAMNRTRGKIEPVLSLPKRGKGPLDTVMVNMTWPEFSELRRKYPSRVLENINTGRVLFNDGSVTLHIPFRAFSRPAEVTLH